jgi:hypothetical protein
MAIILVAAIVLVLCSTWLLARTVREGPVEAACGSVMLGVDATVYRLSKPKTM